MGRSRPSRETETECADTCSPSVSPASRRPPSPSRRRPRTTTAPTPLRSTFPRAVTGTTFEATVDESEPFGCESIRGSVWYSIPPGDERRIAVRVRAGGDLDALVEVFAATRSQLSSVACERTDEDGRGALRFAAAKDQRYLVRVSRRSNSVPGNFQLEVFSPQAPAVPPGAPLPRAGVTLALDRLENTDDAFSARLREGVSYRVNLGPRAERCIGLALYPPGTTTFGEAADPCGPGAAAGTSSSHPDPGRAGVTRSWCSRTTTVRVPSATTYRSRPRVPTTAFPGGASAVSPGARCAVGRSMPSTSIASTSSGAATSTSSLSSSDDTDDFDLQLKRQGGRQLECGCGESGDEEIERRLRPGRYYVAVRTGPQHAGRYQLTRSVRTITSTRVRFNGRRKLSTRPGREVSIGARVRPGVERARDGRSWSASIRSSGSSSTASTAPAQRTAGRPCASVPGRSAAIARPPRSRAPARPLPARVAGRPGCWWPVPSGPERGLPALPEG